MKRILLLLFLAAALFFNSDAQSNPGDSSLLYKYWNYRQRFLNRFVRIGDAPGLSMPVEDYWFSDCRYDWVWGSYPPDLIRDGYGMLVPGGDQTCNLGHYIALLATEYYLLNYNHQNTDSVKRELYYSIKSYFRLEREANEIFHNPDYFGFYLRQDADNDLHLYFQDDSVPANRRYFCTYSEEVGRHYRPDSLIVNFTSQDQTIHLLYGMAMVKRCIPADVKYNGESILELAQEAARRMVYRFYADGWNLKRPNGEEVGNERGGQAWPWAYAIDKTWAYINNTGQTFGDYTYNLGDVALKNLYLCCGQLGGITHFYNKRLFISISSTANTKTVAFNFQYTFNDGLWIYPVSQCIFHNLTMDTADAHLLLDSLYSALTHAPETGPCININGQNPDCQAGKGWVGQNRWLGGRDTRDTITSTNNHPADHNGLDYMLAYNLYRMYTDPNNYVNVYNPTIITSAHTISSKKFNLKIYPNPSSDFISIDYTLPQAATVAFEILDLSGRKVFNENESLQSGHQQKKISMVDLPANAYILCMKVNGEISREKIIKY